MQYVEIKDNIITGHYSSKSVPDGKQFKKISSNFTGCIGKPADWFDWNNKGIRISDEMLIKKGLRADFRGTYYSTQTKEKHKIEELDIKPNNDWTSLKPDINNPFQSWIEEKNTWVIDKIKQQKSELETMIENKKNELSAGDYRVIKASELKTELDNLYPGESVIRKKLRIEINKLQEELGTIKEE